VLEALKRALAGGGFIVPSRPFSVRATVSRFCAAARPVDSDESWPSSVSSNSSPGPGPLFQFVQAWPGIVVGLGEHRIHPLDHLLGDARRPPHPGRGDDDEDLGLEQRPVNARPFVAVALSTRTRASASPLEFSGECLSVQERKRVFIQRSILRVGIRRSDTPSPEAGA
jgi:hypothetical protein